jgi:hypothetical protein
MSKDTRKTNIVTRKAKKFDKWNIRTLYLSEFKDDPTAFNGAKNQAKLAKDN